MEISLPKFGYAYVDRLNAVRSVRRLKKPSHAVVTLDRRVMSALSHERHDRILLAPPHERGWIQGLAN
jgi:hypothetical protein